MSFNPKTLGSDNEPFLKEIDQYKEEIKYINKNIEFVIIMEPSNP